MEFERTTASVFMFQLIRCYQLKTIRLKRYEHWLIFQWLITSSGIYRCGFGQEKQRCFVNDLLT